MMRKILYPFCLAVFCFLLAAISCKKKKQQCCHNILFIRPIPLGFVGYDSTTLSKMSMWSYKANTNFQEVIDTVWLKDLAYIFKNDTAIAGDVQWLYVGANTDYLIKLDDSVLHTITGIISPPGEKECFEATHCSPGSQQSVVNNVQNVHVDGVFTSAYPIYIVK